MTEELSSYHGPAARVGILPDPLLTEVLVELRALRKATALAGYATVIALRYVDQNTRCETADRLIPDASWAALQDALCEHIGKVEE